MIQIFISRHYLLETAQVTQTITNNPCQPLYVNERIGRRAGTVKYSLNFMCVESIAILSF
jgi:hypothetical protein